MADDLTGLGRAAHRSDISCSHKKHISKRVAMPDNVSTDMLAQRRFRSDCAFAQSDQNLPCAQFEQLKLQRFFLRTKKTDQTSRMRKLTWVVFGRTSEGTFSHVAAEMLYSQYNASFGPRLMKKVSSRLCAMCRRRLSCALQQFALKFYRPSIHSITFKDPVSR